MYAEAWLCQEKESFQGLSESVIIAFQWSYPCRQGTFYAPLHHAMLSENKMRRMNAGSWLRLHFSKNNSHVVDCRYSLTICHVQGTGGAGADSS